VLGWATQTLAKILSAGKPQRVSTTHSGIGFAKIVLALANTICGSGFLGKIKNQFSAFEKVASGFWSFVEFE